MEFHPLSCAKQVALMAVFKHTPPFLGAFWFLKSLLVAQLLFALFFKVASLCGERGRRKVLFTLCLLAYMAGIALEKAGFHPAAYSTLPRELCVVLLLCMGYFYRRYEHRVKKNVLVFALGLAALGALAPFFSFDFGAMRFNCVVVLFSSLVGFHCCMAASSYIHGLCRPLSRALTYMGGNTITILALHFLAFKAVTAVRLLCVEGLPSARLKDFPVLEADFPWWLWVAYVVAGCALPMAWQLLTDKMKRLTL